MDIVKEYQKTQSLRETAQISGVSEQKVRKTLLSAGIIPNNPRTKRIMELHNGGISATDIAKILKITEKAVIAHLPYTKGRYNGDNPTKNADKIRKWRRKKEDLEK